MHKPFLIGALLGGFIWPATAQTPSPAPVAPPSEAAAHQHSSTAPKDENNVDYFWRKSDEAFHIGDYERAVGLHRAIVALAPDEIESYGTASWLLWSMGRKDDALAFIARGLQANPRDWEMWNEAGEHYDLQKKLPEALAAYRRAVELMPADADGQMTRRHLAHAAEHAGDVALSAQTWRDLIRDFPNEAVNKNNLARVEKLQAPA